MRISTWFLLSVVLHSFSLTLPTASFELPSTAKPLAIASPLSLPANIPPAVNRSAQTITIKVLVGDLWSSGILIGRQGQNYIILTNQHVLRMGDNYRVQTHDGQIHAASTNFSFNFHSDDLALLTFRSSGVDYPIATLGQSLKLPVGSPIFAAGFPLVPPSKTANGLTLTLGQISMILPKALEGGYQVGYSNLIQKGMSGGPVLNTKGEVVAVNGIHQEPVWGSPYRFKDGQKPSPSLYRLLSHSSWAIPIETVIEAAPRLRPLRPQHETCCR